MNNAVARKRSAIPAAASIGPATTVQVSTPTEIQQVLLDSKRYPSPVRPMGSGSATTRCGAASGGTQMELAAMNRVLRIESDTVTVQPGISLPELAEILSEEGLELIGGFDLANRTVGGAVCAAGLEASMAGDAGPSVTVSITTSSASTLLSPVVSIENLAPVSRAARVTA